MGTEIIREITWADCLPRPKPFPEPDEFQALVHGFFDQARHVGSAWLSGYLLVHLQGKPHNPLVGIDDQAKPPLNQERVIKILVGSGGGGAVLVETWRTDQYVECLADGFAKMVAEHYGAHYSDNKKEVAAMIEMELVK